MTTKHEPSPKAAAEPAPKERAQTRAAYEQPPRGSPYSINEPEARAREHVLTPASINEPPAMQDKPVITALSPDSCAIGDPDFTLFVTGEGFTDNSVIFFAGHDEPTTRNEDGTLSTGVKPSLWIDPVGVQCAVRNGAQVSNALDFEFRAAVEEDTKKQTKHHHPSPPHRRR